MALIRCTECNKEISTGASSCPHCGTRPKRSRTGLWVTFGVIGAGILWAAVSPTSAEDEAKNKERRVIETCWDQQKMKSNDSAESRFIAGACERMEAEYTAKHGRKP